MLLEEKLELEIAFDKFLNSGNPMMKLFDPEYRKKAKVIMATELSKLPQERLIEMLAGLIIDNSNLKQIASYLGNEKIELMRKLESIGNAGLKRAKAHSRGLKDKYQANEDRLMECLYILKSKIKRAIIPTNYISFKSLVMKTYPNQPVIPAYKRDKQEKLQDKELQEANAASGKRTQWSESKLRSFFEKHTGVKPSSVRK